MRRPTRRCLAATENFHSASRLPAKADTRAWPEQMHFEQRQYHLPIHTPCPDLTTCPRNEDQETKTFDSCEWRASHWDLPGCIASSGRGDTSWRNYPVRDEWPGRSRQRCSVPHHEQRGHCGCSSRKDQRRAPTQIGQKGRARLDWKGEESSRDTVHRQTLRCKTKVLGKWGKRRAIFLQGGYLPMEAESVSSARPRRRTSIPSRLIF